MTVTYLHNVNVPFSVISFYLVLTKITKKKKRSYKMGKISIESVNAAHTNEISQLPFLLLNKPE